MSYASNYSAYNEDEWFETKNRILKKRDKCALCGEKAIQLHHIAYFEDKRDIAATNLVPICFRCHELIHHASDYIYEYGGSFSFVLPETVDGNEFAITIKRAEDSDVFSYFNVTFTCIINGMKFENTWKERGMNKFRALFTLSILYHKDLELLEKIEMDINEREVSG